jgi:acyl-CoA synthetase (AMP-forming)/AMP-acid ligase II
LAPNLTAAELTNIVDFLSPSLMLTDESFSGGAGSGIPIVCAKNEVGRYCDTEQFNPVGELDSPALILLTSGTTGIPKSVVLSFRALLARLTLNRIHISDDALANTLCVMPTHFGHGLIGNCLTPLYAGKHLILAPITDARKAADLGSVIDAYDVTFMSLRQVSVGSAPLSKELWQEIIDWVGTNNVVNMYGATEAANWIAGATSSLLAPEDGLIGTMWGGNAGVLDDEGQLHNEGEGELVLQTPSLMAGYYGQPDLTAEVLRGGWFRTGDIGSIDRAGVMRLIGRKKSEINRAGIKVQPEELDSLLERHPEVIEACTFGMPDEISGETVAAAIQLAPESNLNSESLRGWALERIRRENVPERWFFIDEIPKSDRGKINRQTVMAQCMKVAQD